MKCLSETFDTLVRKSAAYSEKEQKTPLWETARILYENNYINCADNVTRIPKNIHQVWLGGKLPDKYRVLSESWKRLHPAWQYRLWTDKDVESFGLKNKGLFYKAKNMGQRSDIFRYEILNRHGGIYIDTDFECLKPFDDLLYLDFFTGISYDTKMVLYIGLIATIPGHPIIESCINSMGFYDGHNSFDVMETTGPYHFTRCFYDTVNKDTKGVVAFPMDFFYPLPNYLRNSKEPYKYVKDFSYAIHHWAVTWMK
jgi:mannosyltransferase OCH1-like enzyme